MKGAVTHSLVKALRAAPGFELLSDPELLEIVGASVNLKWPAGTCVFQKGSHGEALYIVLSGEVRIYDEVDGKEIEIARTGVGQFFGESSLVLDTTHTKNAIVSEDAELLVLSKDSFATLLKSNANLAEHIQETLEQRRSEAEEKYQTEIPS